MQARSWLARWLTPKVILLVGWAAFALYAFPGFIAADSVDQLTQARGEAPLGDWHPPMMAFIWRITDTFISGPLPMLVLQSVAFLLGTYFIFKRVISPTRAATTAVVVLLLPHNIIVMGVVWKDALMGGFLVAGVAGLLATTLRWRLVGCFLIFLATAVRYNAPAATLPLLALMWDRDLAKAWYKRLATGAAVWLAITVAAFLANAALVEHHEQPFGIGTAPVDIEGILHFGPEIDVDQLVRETPDVPWKAGVDVRAVSRTYYKPFHALHQLYNGDAALFDYPTTPAQADALAALWKRLVREHPGAFARHRLAVSGAQLDCAVSVWHSFSYAPWAEDSLQHRARASALQDLWVSAMIKTVRLRVFRPRVYFWLSFLLLPFARRSRFVAALLLSGIANELGLFAVAPSIAYRYSHWMVFCTLLAIVLLVIERSRLETRRESTA